MKLKDITCKNAKSREKPYKLADGEGMYLEIMPNGSKYWRLKYRYQGLEKRYAIGVYPAVSLSEAREVKTELKATLRKGLDPMALKKAQRNASLSKTQNTFKAVALEWHSIRRDSWSDNYASKVLKGLELNIFPYIGHLPITEITPPILLNDCLRRIEKRGSLDIAGRTRQICSQVFRYGIQTGKCDWDAANNLKGALKVKRTKHFRTLTIEDLPSFLNTLERNEARLFERTRRAVWLSLYTFCRPKEIRTAKWQDIDLNKALWIIPAENMKTGRDHVVPLAKQALETLHAQKLEVSVLNSPWVFPAQNNHSNPMSDGTVNKAIQRLGFGDKLVAHGFRALARTTIREELKYDAEIIEKQLAHKSRGPLGEAYDRTQFLADRTNMMQEWADLLTNKLKA